MSFLRISTSASGLLAVSQHAARSRRIPALNCVAVEVRSGKVYLVASDGKTMAAMQSGELFGEEDPTEDFTLLIPIAAVRQIKKWMDVVSISRGPGDVWFINEDRTWEIEFRSLGDAYPIDLRWLADAYPVDWRAMVPRQLSGTISLLDPALLMRFVKSARLLQEGREPCLIRLMPDKPKSPMLVHMEGHYDFVGVMPTLGDDGPLGVTDYLQGIYWVWNSASDSNITSAQHASDATIPAP